jgi:hypothetical protein
LIKRNEGAANGEVWGDDEQHGGNERDDPFAARQPITAREMRQRGEPPSSDEQVECTKQKERSRCHQNDEQASAPTGSEREQYAQD